MMISTNQCQRWIHGFEINAGRISLVICFVHFDFTRRQFFADAATFLCCVRIQIERFVANISNEIVSLIRTTTHHTN